MTHNLAILLRLLLRPPVLVVSWPLAVQWVSLHPFILYLCFICEYTSAAGAVHAHITQMTMEDFIDDNANRATVTASAVVTFTFPGATPDAFRVDYPPEREVNDPQGQAPTETLVPTSPSSSVISIDSTVSELTDYPPSFDDGLFRILDTTGLQPSLATEAQQPDIPTPTPSPEPCAPTNVEAGPSGYPAPHPPSTASGERWYVVTVGVRVGVFRGW